MKERLFWKKSLVLILAFMLLFPSVNIARVQAGPVSGLSIESAVTDDLDGGFNSIIYAAGQYTAVGDGGKIIQSADGLSWTKLNVPSANAKASWTSIAFNSGTYVVSGVEYTNPGWKAVLIVSTDGGGTWTDKSSSINASTLQKVRYINGAFYAVGGRYVNSSNQMQDLGVVYTSADGQSWSQWTAVPYFLPASTTTNVNFYLSDIAYFSGRYIITGSQFGSYAYSSDGTNWTVRFLGKSFSLGSLSEYNGKLYTSHNWNEGYSSTDGMTFTADAAYDKMLGSTQAGPLLYRYGGAGALYSSANSGASWTAVNNVTNHTIRAAASNGTGMVLITFSSQSLIVSSDRMNWKRLGGNLQEIASNGSTWAVAGSVNPRLGGEGLDGFISSSPGGWIGQSPADSLLPGLGLAAITYGNNLFVAAGKKFGTSADGLTWTLTDLPAGTGTTVKGLAYGSSGFVAITNNNSILTSANGSSWTGGTTLNIGEFYNLKYVNGVYVAFGDGGIWASTNGMAWNSLDSLVSYSYAIYDVTYANGKYIVAYSDGNDGTPRVLETAGALSGSSVWTEHIIDANAGWTVLNSIDYGNGNYVAVGIEYDEQSNEHHVMYTSSDLVTWTKYDEQALGVSGGGLNQVIFQNGKFYIVGNGNTTIVLGNGGAVEETPAAGIDYAAEELTGLSGGASYTVNGNPVTADSSGKLAISSSWLGTSLSIVKKGDGSLTTDSPAQTLVIPARPAAPTGVGKTDQSLPSVNNGALTNVAATMEYKQGASGAWMAITGATVTGLAPDTYDVRLKATASAFASEAQSVTVAAFTASPELTPVAVIDYAAEELTDLTASGSYTVNGNPVTADSSGKLAISSSWLGTSLSIVKKGDGSLTTDSPAQTLVIPARPGAPTGVGKTDQTLPDTDNGTLTNVAATMEYKQGASGAWTAITGTTVTGLAPDTYAVRLKATASAFASEAQSVTVAAFTASPELTPAAVIDYAAEGLTDLTASGSYTVNGNPVTVDGSGKLAISSSWLGTSLSIVKKGDGSLTTDSPAQTLAIPLRPAAPTGVGKTDQTLPNTDNGTLTNVAATMEYKQGASGAWMAITGATVTGLAPDAYAVRLKATASAFASEAQSVTVAAFTASPELTPVAVIDYAAEELTDLTASGSYTVNGNPVTADSSGKLAISSSWLGTSLSIVKKGNGVATTDSPVQTVMIPARPGAPIGVTVTDVTYKEANDGTLQNLTLQMEYKQGSEGIWADVSDTVITHLAPATYYVREKATSTTFASVAVLVTVHDSDAVIPAAPEVTADDQGNTIIGLDTSMEFAVDEGNYVRYDGTNLPDLSGEHTVKVRVATSGAVPAGPATELIFTTNAPVQAGGLTVNASDPSGTVNNGMTQITVTPLPAEGHKLVFKNFGADIVVIPNVGDILTGYTLIESGGLAPAANGDKLGIAEVDASGKVVKYGATVAVVIPETVIPDTNAGGNTGSVGSNPNTGTATNNTSVVTDVIVLVNGKQENAGTATTTTSGAIKTTIIAVDPAKLQARLDAEGNGAVITIPVTLDSNIIVGELSGQMIQNMENLSATLVLQTSKASYVIPAKQINIGALAQQLGAGVKLEDIKLRITIGETSASMNQVIAGAASNGGFTLVAPSLDFTVTGTYGNSTQEISRFNVYVKRKVALPEGIDLSRITTGIVVDPNGTVRHVPTRVIRENGQYFAEINSLTNSSYSVVWHPLSFADVEKHWAKDAVNDMGSRMVINGVNESTFNPNADITRAEFAAIIVRGLGLKLEDGLASFADVPASAWYAGAVETAAAYGLITGFEDGLFRPDALITREQAMNIIAKAMKLTGLADRTDTVDPASVLAGFKDGGIVGGWAKESLALAVKAGLITGRGDSMLEAKANVTRAEVAVLIQRLLLKSDLTD
ncbi:S-layer homology domain-containing protein [Paenibacillus sp. MMS20-IR301]|uniref:S-layer homology domain-containing protein n=1 Tax=Paenibacillus sp. MMS20-IR301 TaxID=2895946 RepID=UPI0028EFC558|nr:S-layer homology domain-containing protein [Paenibacillus sp. MMS20-IR301]WNS41491.1 S-layer homology domain-containing protein [Paenibacillus sp. MMS20-IR301]